MATYDEIFTLANTGAGAALANKIQVAVVVAAEKISRESSDTAINPNHVNRVKWAKSVFQNPAGAQRDMIMIVLVKAMAFTTTQIAGAADALVQTYVDASVDSLALG